ncbi:EutN/CcmL family microcompartment protein [Microtetraspora fusca]|uniref:EutN/CcmL family microcompartment protein n=1 Tax=Microtetraspora fusca TaxID=1997 RepID=A0ABW6VFU7_MICFU|nr:EutN/CcmL family microcompartment protein [Microtetraspora fusca]
MLRGTVTASVWATKRIDGIPGGAFLEVELDGGGRMVAFDVLGTGMGERVLVVQGSVAASWFTARQVPPPIDALIIGSIDDPQ